ncbi:MAG: tRNA (guanosine(37)-N1)-methyltransferase TrmD [bacterium]
MEAHVLTVFPEMYRQHRNHGIMGKAVDKDKLELTPWSLRRFTDDRNGNIDDHAYGGEFGMVLKPEPFFRGVDHITETRGDATVMMTSPGGRQFDNDAAKRLSKRSRMIILTGRYEGVDQRVRDHLVDEVWSIGPYVTPGGDLPALVLLSSIIRHIDGVLGNETSIQRDSFQNDRLAPPHYTRPQSYRGHDVPEVLLSGDHQRIEEWRRHQAKQRTKRKRPELIEDRKQETS